MSYEAVHAVITPILFDLNQIATSSAFFVVAFGWLLFHGRSFFDLVVLDVKNPHSANGLERPPSCNNLHAKN